MNFDEIVNRKGTDCVKWDEPYDRYGYEDLVPMWVADMDIEVAKPIQEALMNRVKHPVYGYQKGNKKYKEAFINHFNNRCNHTVRIENVILSTGVVYSINACIQKLTKEHDKVMVHFPSYHPFQSVTLDNNRELIESPLKLEDGKYVMDFDDMEAKSEGVKVLILCNPQNPTGRLFTREELEKLADFVERHNIVVISDEIHSDFIYDNQTFVPFMDINKYTKNHTITCVSCTKSFNLAGLNVSAMFIKNKELYKTIKDYMDLNGLSCINIFGMEAMYAAYTESEEWLNDLVKYLQNNRDYILDYINKYLPDIKVCKPESTYLMWMDMSAYQHEHMQRDIMENVHVYTNDGKVFGENYNKFIRFNYACPLSQVKEALERMREYLYD